MTMIPVFLLKFIYYVSLSNKSRKTYGAPSSTILTYLFSYLNIYVSRLYKRVDYKFIMISYCMYTHFPALYFSKSLSNIT